MLCSVYNRVGTAFAAIIPWGCSEIEPTNGRNRTKGLLKVMSSFVTVGGEKTIRWDSALSVRPEMRQGDM